MHNSIILRAGLAALALSCATQAAAEAPEQLYEPAPALGEWRLEYNGQIGRTEGSPRPHSLELFRGISEHIALGVEIEGEAEDGRLLVEEFGVGAIFGLTGEDAPVEAALLVQAGVTTEGDFPQLEARLIVEHERGPWEMLGNVNVRRVDAEEQGTSLGYAATVHRRLSDNFALGVETSGQAARLGGYTGGFDAGHYAGPSATLSFDVANGREVELGIRYLRRIDAGDAYRDTVRLVFGFAF